MRLARITAKRRAVAVVVAAREWKQNKHKQEKMLCFRVCVCVCVCVRARLCVVKEIDLLVKPPTRARAGIFPP